MTTVIDVDGVDVRSAPIFNRDCSFPITNLSRRCKRDQAFQAMPIWFGGWEDGVKQPAITAINYQVDTTTSAGDACKAPVVRASLDGCELLVPNMTCLKFSTPVLTWKDLVNRYCRRRNLSNRGIRIFTSDGVLDFEQEHTLNILKLALAAIWDVLGLTLVESTMGGDASDLNHFDGLYTQLANGWQQSTTDPCPALLNTEQAIDWAALCGKAAGETASPDDCTVAGATVTIWGETFPVPAGINLAEFIDDLWIEKIAAEGVFEGEVEQWELHTAWGQSKCIMNTVNCMRPCATCDDDPDARDRLSEFRLQQLIELYPSRTRVPVMQSRSMPLNTMRFGPRMIDGEYTYGLIIDDIDKHLSMLPTNPWQRFEWDPEESKAHSFLCSDDWRAEIESRGLFWNLYPTSTTCLQGEVQLCAGLIATNRHLWLRIDNVACASLLNPDCDTTIEIV